MGKPLDEALGEVDFAAGIYAYYADHAERFLADEPVELLDGEGSAVVRRSPFGPLLGIMPWNFPYYQVARFAAPEPRRRQPDPAQARAAVPRVGRGHRSGCSTTPGAPPGTYVNVFATNEQVADVIADPRVRGRVAHRLGAGRRRRRRGRRPPPEEGRARARRLRPVPRAGDATTSTRSSTRPSPRASTTPARPATPAKRFVVVSELYAPFVERFTERLLASGDGRAAVVGRRGRDARPAGRRGRGAGRAPRERRRARPAPSSRPGVLTGVTPEHDGLRPGAVRSGRDGLRGGVGGRRRADRQRHAVRPGLVRLHDRPRAGAARGRPARRRHGVRQRRRRRGPRAALRRRRSAPASAASSAAPASGSSSTRS